MAVGDRFHIMNITRSLWGCHIQGLVNKSRPNVVDEPVDVEQTLKSHQNPDRRGDEINDA